MQSQTHRANSTAPDSARGKDIVVLYSTTKDYKPRQAINKKGIDRKLTKRETAVGTPGSHPRFEFPCFTLSRTLTVKEMQNISRRALMEKFGTKFASTKQISSKTPPPLGASKKQPTLSGAAGLAVPMSKRKGQAMPLSARQKKTVAKSPSTTAMLRPDSKQRKNSLRIDGDTSPDILVIPASTIILDAVPRSATLSMHQKFCLSGGSSPGHATLCKTPRLPATTTSRASTFASAQELERTLHFTEEQNREFVAIEGMQRMKSRRSLLRVSSPVATVHAQTVDTGGKGGKLKPIERLQRFAAGSPVVSKGKHKFFK